MSEAQTSTQRFRSAAQRAINAKRLLSYSKLNVDAREPGIDPRRVDLPDLQRQLVIQAVDFDAKNAEFCVLKNHELSGFLDKPRLPGQTRWIHVNGLSWDVIKQLALHYELHPLAIEDALHHSTASIRSKADYYARHLFVSVAVHRPYASEQDMAALLQKLPATGTVSELTGSREASVDKGSREDFDEEAQIDSDQPQHDRDGSDTLAGTLRAVPSPGQTHGPTSYERYVADLAEAFVGSEVRSEEEKDEEADRTLSTNLPGQSNSLGGRKRSSSHGRADRLAARRTVTSLTKDLRVHIHIEQLSCFLLRDGTLISIAQDPGYHHRYSSIFGRIASPGDLVRESGDASLVLQALLDVTGDYYLDIVEHFQIALERLEARVLTNADMGDVRHLHVLSAQLILLKSTLSPLQQVIHSLRIQDEAKAAAACRVPLDLANRQNVGFISFEAKVFLADVLDHVESALASLELFSNLAENLIAFTFNDLSFKSNAYMSALSVLSVIFLPLTFLSGYFGMNFETFPHVLDGGVSYFWKIAIPTAVTTTLVFSYRYLYSIVTSARREALRLYHKAVYKHKMA